VLREVDPFTYPGQEPGLFDFAGGLPGPGVQLVYNNWGGYEVSFNVWPRNRVNPEVLFATIFGYYSEETLRNSTPYDIERRDDPASRWHQVYSVKGRVDMGIDDPEMLEASIDFGIELKQPLRELPFFIQSIPLRSFDGSNKARVLHVNSVRLDGQELTWTRTSQLGGVVVLPREMPAGTRLELRMDFKTRALVKWTQAFTQVSRFGWMPFVRFADFIDEFELTIRSPARYKVLGIGHQVTSQDEGETVVTHWKADNPVVFPSIALGDYELDTAGRRFDPARKIDGTEIPVVVHVDKDSFSQWGIAPKNLRPIAQQAVNSINLFQEISGLDYPYGELNLVNDPRGFLYGQAPSSLIYLGSGVFRGEGFLAAVFANNPYVNSTRISKFLKSVVAHEVGHQWWGSRISNANARNYWFVESLAEYFSALYLEAVYGRREYEEQVEEWRQRILGSNLKASVQNASALWSGEGGGYTAAVYNKGPFAFHMLRQIFGDARFFSFLRRFSQDLAAKREIVTLDIQRSAENALGGITADGNPYRVDLGWFFDQWIRSAGLPQFRFDYRTRKTEDGTWLLEGVIEQRVVVGSERSYTVVQDMYYRGIVDIKVRTRDGDFAERMVVEGRETPFRFKLASKPTRVTLNEGNETLAHDVQVEW
jgi:aminopeptidase N